MEPTGHPPRKVEPTGARAMRNCLRCHDVHGETANLSFVNTNVVFRPTSQFHLGLWFNSSEDAAAARCAPAVTPFNGEQHAGSQILSTRNFAPDHGPLEAIG
jgi:hypothetical protein